MLKMIDSHIVKCILIIIMGIFISFIPQRKYEDTSPFKICQSLSIVSDDYIDTSISVIMITEEYEVERIFTEIKDFHNSMNEESDKLTIHLYNSKEDLKNHNCIGSKIYYKEKR